MILAKRVALKPRKAGFFELCCDLDKNIPDYDNFEEYTEHNLAILTKGNKQGVVRYVRESQVELILPIDYRKVKIRKNGNIVAYKGLKRYFFERT